MDYIKLLLLIAIIPTSCINKNASEERESRLDRIQHMPFRSTAVSDELKAELIEIGKLVWDEFLKRDTTGQLKLVSSMNEDKFFSVQWSSDDIQPLRSQSYQMWVNNELAWTALAYKSSSVNTQTNVQSSFYVIEIEHQRLTGTFYIFVPFTGRYEIDKLKFTYQDRNS